MNLDEIDIDLIVARGRYATINGAYKDNMQAMQHITQKACDTLRAVLQDEVNRHNHMEYAEKLLTILKPIVQEAAELKAQKDELYQAAWGK
jgi:hypothetical protein